MKLALAPIPFFWPPDRVRAFYDDIARSAIDIVYLGETVCYKRRGLRLADWMALGEQLIAAGKEVVLSSLILVDGEAELKATRRLCAQGEFPVEANEMAAVQACAGRPFVAGLMMNLYNEEALAIIAACGARRFVAALELGREALTALNTQRPPGLECEVLAFGRPTLATSARCFTARADDHGKDDCDLRCRDHEQGIPVATQEGQPFLVINGLHILGARPVNLIDDIESLRDAGVDVLRLVPDNAQTGVIIDTFHKRLDGRHTADEARQRLMVAAGPGTNGYWRGMAGALSCP
ncbi:MAG: ubiquinone anaerobic biosynthesis protein UbiV [Acidiferrobacter sp.]